MIQLILDVNQENQISQKSKYIPLYPQAPSLILTLTLTQFMLNSQFLGPERFIILSLGQALAGCLSQTRHSQTAIPEHCRRCWDQL